MLGRPLYREAESRLCVNYLDEEQFAGGGAYLFASVLERFLSLYASINSFTALTVRTQQRGTIPLRRWAPRAGCRALV